MLKTISGSNYTLGELPVNLQENHVCAEYLKSDRSTNDFICAEAEEGYELCEVSISFYSFTFYLYRYRLKQCCFYAK